MACEGGGTGHRTFGQFLLEAAKTRPDVRMIFSQKKSFAASRILDLTNYFSAIALRGWRNWQTRKIQVLVAARL
jgi:hypothetical protein